MDNDLLKVSNICFKFKAITKTWMSSRSHLVNPFISQMGKQTQECELICPKPHSCLVAEPRANTNPNVLPFKPSHLKNSLPDEIV